MPKNDDFEPTAEDIAAAAEDPYFTQKELDDLRSVICSNCALAHMFLKNWGYVRDESKKVRRFSLPLNDIFRMEYKCPNLTCDLRLLTSTRAI